MKKRIEIDTENFTLYEYKKASLFSNEIVEDNKTVLPMHLIELVQKSYNRDGTNSIAIFFETKVDEYFFTQDDLENNLEELFDEFIKIRDKLLQSQDSIHVYRIEEYNVDTAETVDR